MHMADAPRDGTRVLIQNQVMHFVAYGLPYERDGTEIVECRYHEGQWVRWCGNPRINTTARIIPLAWWPKPGDVADDGPLITTARPRRRFTGSL
jgi:hypothetical protein